jgi:protein-tyrosine phosphatase
VRGWVRLLLAQLRLGFGAAMTQWTQIRVPVVKRRLVFVCLGNINRSAFADVLAQEPGRSNSILWPIYHHR